MYERWYNGSSIRKITAQVISLAIRGHHGGLLDCVDPNGRSVYLDSIRQDKEKLEYQASLTHFLSEIASEAELDELFASACRELETLLRRVERNLLFYTQGMLARVILSIVVDADRWDTACFENNEVPFTEDKQTDWDNLVQRLKNSLSRFSRSSTIGELRGRISDACAKAASNKPGIYTLTVPTGGGKTLSSLRYALEHARQFPGRSRIFYVIPFNTILEQNSDDLRRALDDYPDILEHFGTFTSNQEGEDGEREELEHLLLTERWDAPIIMTSMVQFLNTFYRAENTCARRLHRLAGAVLIFDEIQALPKRCRTLFEQAVLLLSLVFNCTILLCTATQPDLSLPSMPLLPPELTEGMFSTLKRTCLIENSQIPRDNVQAARDIAALANRYGSVLVIVNTKRVAAEVFSLLKNMHLPAECVHLSTNMCPAHRLNIIKNMKELLEAKERSVICVSTMLIEAGIDISFPCVVRSLGGLPSILQAAGRCNRHMDWPKGGFVYIWRFAEESLGQLQEIGKGQKVTKSVIEALGQDNCAFALDSLEALELYFEKEKQSYPEVFFNYLWEEQKNRDVTLTDMLGMNQALRQDTDYEVICGKRIGELRLYQAFSTAGRVFRVIEQDVVTVLVPYEEGERLIALLCSDQSLAERTRTIRRAQMYSVGVWRNAFIRLVQNETLYPIEETGQYALRKEYYDLDLGLVTQPHELDFMNY